MSESRQGPNLEHRLRLRSRVQAIRSGDRLYLRLLDRFAKIEPAGDLTRQFIKLLFDGGKLSEILDRLELREGSIERNCLLSCFVSLFEAGFVEDMDLSHGLSEKEAQRFHRLILYLSAFETEDRSRYDLMERLLNARVCLLGVGGIGSWTFYGLLCMGIQNISLVDHDEIELTNLNRAILFDEQDIGKSKVDVAVQRGKAFWPQARIQGYSIQVTGATDLVDIVRGHDLVVSQIDHPAYTVQGWVAEACHAARVPLLPLSSLKVGPLSIPDKTGCILCYQESLLDRYSDFAETFTTNNELASPVRPSIAATGTITAGVACRETLRFLSGEDAPVTLGAVWVMDERTMTAEVQPVNHHPRCRVCKSENVGINM